MKRVLDAMVAISSDLELATVLQRIVEAACDLSEARYGALGVVGGSDIEGLHLTEFITNGADDATIEAIGHYPRGKGILGLLIKDPRVLRLHDLTKHAQSYGFPEGHPEMHTFLGVPVRIRDRVFGNLYLTEKAGGGDFTEEDEELVLALASAAGVAIENARLQTRVKTLAVLEDRERIARDLHDNVIQRLFATGLSLQGVSRMAGDASIADRIQHSVDELDDTIREIRGVIFALQMHEHQGVSLRLSLLSQVSEATSALGFEARVHFDGPIENAIDPSMAEQISVVVRELLSNVAKHAQATQADVYLRVGHEISVEVTDNGVGPGDERDGGNGIPNLRTRSKGLGGTFLLSARASGGSSAKWTVPRPAAETR